MHKVCYFSNHWDILPPSLDSLILESSGILRVAAWVFPFLKLGSPDSTFSHPGEWQAGPGPRFCAWAWVCTHVHLGLAASRACTQLIYNPPRKQNCKAHPQIFPTEVLVTGRHAMNSQEQSGLPAASAPEKGPR